MIDAYQSIVVSILDYFFLPGPPTYARFYQEKWNRERQLRRLAAAKVELDLHGSISEVEVVTNKPKMSLWAAASRTMRDAFIEQQLNTSFPTITTWADDLY